MTMMLFIRAAVCLVCVAVGTTHAASLAKDAGEEDANTRAKRESFDMVNFLQNYGYLQVPEDNGVENVFHSEAVIKQAIRDFQAFTGLEVTGQLDLKTLDKMNSPRCGFPDMAFAPPDTATKNDLSRPQSFYTLGTRWNKDTVTWNAQTLSRKLPESDQRQAIENGLKYWSDVIPIKFRPTTGEADIEIKFARGEHGDGYQNRFNGRGGVLAHAFQPGPGIGGDTHFDEDESWSLGTGRGTDLEIVAAHEFGHALGLGHSNVPGALMAPYYSYSSNLQLHDDDIRGIQSLYGSKRQTTPRPTTTKPTTTTTPSTTTTTTTEATTTTTSSSLPSFCGPDFKVDAIANGEGGTSYLFHHDKVYKVGPWGLEPSYPRYIQEIFPNGPRDHVSAAVFLPETNTHYLFKGSRVWRYTNYRLNEGYPRVWLSSQDYYRFRPSSALTFTYGPGITMIFMFGDNTFWEWNPISERVSAGYPLKTSLYWVGAPHRPEAATSDNNNNFYFFKGDRYYKLHNRVSVGESKPLGKDWFGSLCEANTFLDSTQN